jgi:hypothetical protein
MLLLLLLLQPARPGLQSAAPDPLALCPRHPPPAQTSEPVSICSGHRDWVTGIQLMPAAASGSGGLQLLTSSLDWTARCWQLARPQALCSAAFVGHASGVSALQVRAGDGALLGGGLPARRPPPSHSLLRQRPAPAAESPPPVLLPRSCWRSTRSTGW